MTDPVILDLGGSKGFVGNWNEKIHDYFERPM